MASTGVEDVDPLRTPTRLIDFLAEVTGSANRNPLRDITAKSRGAPDPLLWLHDLPGDVTCRPDAVDGVLLTVAPVSRPPGPPELPEKLRGWSTNSSRPRGRAPDCSWTNCSKPWPSGIRSVTPRDWR